MTKFRILLKAAVTLGAGAALMAPTAHASTTSTIAAEENINTPYNELLAKHLVQEDGINLFKYGAVTKEDRQKLADYVVTLQAQKPSQMSADEQIAFWANLYNAKTLEVILDNYPVESIRDIKSGVFSSGPWKMELLEVEGESLSLDNVEHDIVRAEFEEPRVHYAFNCASIGCPNLKTSAWEAATLDEDLDAAAREYITHPRGIRVEGNKVIASSIYKWFKVDFGNNDRAVLEHVRQYATDDKLSALEGRTKINKHEYDWSLNEPE